MIDITTLRAMAKAGATVDVILAAVEAELVAEGVRVQARRVKDAERQRRNRHAESRPVTRSHNDMEVSLASLLPSSISTPKKEERKKERARKTHLPEDWLPKPRHYEKAKKFNHPDGFVDRKADSMRSWAASKAIMRANWDATFDGFIEPKEGQSNGLGGSRPLQDDSKSISRAGRELAEKARRGEFSFGPRPSILPAKSDDDVFLLPKG
jgi:hypothetical protein